MRRLIALAPCTAVFALLAAAQIPEKPRSPVIGIYMDFEHAPEGVSVEAMKRAVERLFQPSGVRLAWRLSTANEGKEAFSDLAVLTFHGRCRAETPRATSGFGTLGETDTLAFTEISHGRILPY